MRMPFCCIQLSGVRLIGSKVLKNTSENSLCLPVFPISPVEHSVHLKNSCCLAYQTSPAPVISKSRVTLNASNGSFLKGYGATRHTQSCRKKNVRCIRHDIGYDIISDILCDIRYERVFFYNLYGVLQASAGRRGLVKFFSVRRTKKVIIFPTKCLWCFGDSNTRLQVQIRLHVPLSHWCCICTLKILLYLYPFDMIPDIRYDIRYDISIVLVLDSTEARRSSNLLQTLFNCSWRLYK